MVDENGREVVMMRFLDGPFAGEGNTPNLGGSADYTFPADSLGGWPLPGRVAVKRLGDRLAVAGVPAGIPEDAVTEVADCIYRKVGESQLSEQAAREMDHVVRGAQYKLEEVG